MIQLEPFRIEFRNFGEMYIYGFMLQYDCTIYQNICRPYNKSKTHTYKLNMHVYCICIDNYIQIDIYIYIIYIYHIHNQYTSLHTPVASMDCRCHQLVYMLIWVNNIFTPKMITGSQQKHDGRSMMFFLKASNISAFELEMEFVQSSSFWALGWLFSLEDIVCWPQVTYPQDPWELGIFTYI